MKFLGVYTKKEDSYKKVKKITDAEYEEYKRTVKRMYSINEALSLLSAVRGNYIAYMELMKYYVQLYVY